MKLNVLKNNKGYIMHDGKVQYIEITQINRFYNEVEDTHSHSIVCRIGGKGTTLNTIPTLYNTEDGCINENNQVGHEHGVNHQISNIIGNKFSTDVYYWTANGIKYDVVGHLDLRITPSTKKVWKKNEETDKYGWGEEFCWKVEIINLTDKIYSTEDLAKADHAFEVVEADGTTHIHPSFASIATLTESQQAVFDNLIAAFKACKDAKVGIVIHHYEGCISAYNDDNNVDFGTGWEAPQDSSVAIDQILPDKQNRVEASFTYCGEEDSLWAN